jgi:hypothetical protein
MMKTISESRERIVVLVFCFLAAVHVFVFSAAFPFFNNMDEFFHFDLVVKYSHGHLPRGLEPVSEESMQYATAYGSPEYRWRPDFFPNGHYPVPFWKQPGQSEESGQAAVFQQASESWRAIKNTDAWENYESAQQPLYYAVAGLWWNAGQCFGLKGLSLLYWLRFLSVPFVSMLVWAGYFAARLIFKENSFLRTGVPAFIAFFPQQAFYSIQNDVLSPLCFGAAFIYLVKFSRSEIPGVRLGMLMGLALSATFLTKLSNAPLLVISGMFIALKILQLAKNGKLRGSLPALALLIFCAAAPIAGWLAWTKYAFGDLTGTAAKLQFITWTPKPFAEWWHHPIFTPQGFWTFVSDLLVTFWQGEFHWHGSPLDLPLPDAIYVVLTLSFVAMALMTFRAAHVEQRRALLLSLGCLLAGIAFLGYLSIAYDFGICPNPSREHPYFTAGRLILGALIPFLLLFLSGVDFLLRDLEKKWALPIALTAIILFMLVSEVITDWPVFASQYNWYHT